MAEKYDIILNNNDDFQGNKIAILYDPGSFPAFLKEKNNTVPRNGVVPQEGNLTEHILAFEKVVESLIPDQKFTGKRIDAVMFLIKYII